MDELQDQGVSSDDGHDSAADVISEADHPTQSVDDNGHENWAEDAEPLTRGEYADQMRQSPAIEENDSTADRDTDRDDGTELAVAEDNQESEELPEPRTRQEVADEADRADPAIVDHDQAADADLNASIAEEDNLPEPRTRQEVAEGARSGTDPLTHGETDGRQHQPDAEDWSSPEERAQLHETYLNWRNEISAGREQGTNVVGDKPDRSPDDRSDLPPTGEQLLDMESDSTSRFERLRGHLYKDADDITDVAEKVGNRALELFDHPPTETSTEVPSGHPEITNQAPPTVEGGQLVLAGLMVGMLGYELGRAVKNRIETWKGR